MKTCEQVKVWDGVVRVFHWSLVISFATAYLSTEGSRQVHFWAGYVALALIFTRLVWGFAGSGHARFSDFVPGPRHLLRYVRASLKRREPRYLGHNPAAAIMILYLLAMVTAIGVTGWMLTLDAFWGDETLEEVHAAMVNVTIGAVALHVAAAIYESMHHRENLIRSMVTGKKRAYSASDITPGDV